MTGENVEIVHDASSLMNVGDFDAAFEMLDPDIEWVVAGEHPSSRTITGREALAEYQRDWQEVLGDMRVEYERVLDAGHAVVAIGTVRGTGTESGADVRVPIAFLITLRNGLIARVEEYLNPVDALEAAGLSE